MLQTVCFSFFVKKDKVNSLYILNVDSIPLDILLTSSDMRDYAIQSDCYKEYIKSWNEEQVKYYYKYNKGEQHCELPSNWYSPETAFMIYSQVENKLIQ